MTLKKSFAIGGIIDAMLCISVLLLEIANPGLTVLGLITLFIGGGLFVLIPAILWFILGIKIEKLRFLIPLSMAMPLLWIFWVLWVFRDDIRLG